MQREVEGRLVLGLVAALIIGLTVVLHPINLLFAPVPLLLWRRKTERIAIVVALTLGVLIGPRPAPQLTSKTLVNGPVTIATVPRIYPDQVSFEASVPQIGILQVYLHGRPDIALGDQLLVTGMARPLNASIEKYFAVRGIRGTLRPNYKQMVRRGPLLYRWATAWRESFDEFSHRVLPERFAAVASALCFNMDRLLDDDLTDALSRTGTVHIVSVSGLHVVVLVASLLWTLGKVPIPRWLQLAIAALLLGFYALATGLNPPTVRAVIMGVVGLSAYLLKRDGDWLTSLGFTAFIYLLLRPNAVYDIGFQLSFATVAAFCLFLRPDRELPSSPVAHWGAIFKGTVIASLVASLFSAPLVAYHFGQISLVSVLANVLIAFVVPAIIVSSFTCHGLFFVVPAVASLAMAIFVQPWIAFLEWVVFALSKLSWAVVSIPEFNGYLLVPVYAAMLMTWRVSVRQP